MKALLLLFSILSALLLVGCLKKTEAPIQPPSDDASEPLIQHLLRRVSDLTEQLEKSKNETLEHDNKCLEEQIAALEGRPVPTRKHDPVAATRALSESLQASNERMAQQLLDTEAAISYHNLRHPDDSWANVEDVLKEICGNCTKQRAFRDSQLKEEAQKYPQRKRQGAPSK